MFLYCDGGKGKQQKKIKYLFIKKWKMCVPSTRHKMTPFCLHFTSLNLLVMVYGYGQVC